MVPRIPTLIRHDKHEHEQEHEEGDSSGCGGSAGTSSGSGASSRSAAASGSGASSRSGASSGFLAVLVHEHAGGADHPGSTLQLCGNDLTGLLGAAECAAPD